MPDSKVISSIDTRGVATVTINNPDKHNAFDDAIISDLRKTFDALNTDQSVRIVVLASTGKTFSAGADLDWMKRMANYDYDENLRDARAMADMLYALNSLSRPTIARVQGVAFGGAVGLVSCCDIALGTPETAFSLSEVKLGIVPATISPYVIAVIGQRMARRYFLTAEKISADTAREMGLLSEVVSIDELDDTLDVLITRLLENGPKAVAIAKKLICDVSRPAITEQLQQQTSELIADLRVSEEGQEGLTAFLEKRLPQWNRK